MFDRGSACLGHRIVAPAFVCERAADGEGSKARHRAWRECVAIQHTSATPAATRAGWRNAAFVRDTPRTRRCRRGCALPPGTTSARSLQKVGRTQRQPIAQEDSRRRDSLQTRRVPLGSRCVSARLQSAKFAPFCFARSLRFAWRARRISDHQGVLQALAQRFRLLQPVESFRRARFQQVNRHIQV
jgi:hypothetical protein